MVDSSNLRPLFNAEIYYRGRNKKKIVRVITDNKPPVYVFLVRYVQTIELLQINTPRHWFFNAVDKPITVYSNEEESTYSAEDTFKFVICKSLRSAVFIANIMCYNVIRSIRDSDKTYKSIFKIPSDVQIVSEFDFAGSNYNEFINDFLAKTSPSTKVQKPQTGPQKKPQTTRNTTQQQSEPIVIHTDITKEELETLIRQEEEDYNKIVQEFMDEELRRERENIDIVDDELKRMNPVPKGGARKAKDLSKLTRDELLEKAQKKLAKMNKKQLQAVINLAV